MVSLYLRLTIHPSIHLSISRSTAELQRAPRGGGYAPGGGGARRGNPAASALQGQAQAQTVETSSDS